MIEGTLPVQEQDIVFEDALFVRNHSNTLQEGWLKGRIDTNDAGIFGHSKAGAAATAVPGRDLSIQHLNFNDLALPPYKR